MNMQTLHALDAALFGAAPTLMVPRYGEIPDIAVGAKRFLAAATGPRPPPAPQTPGDEHLTPSR